MLKEKEYREISVLDLVADSKVNRNTFYYHFKDLPDLVAEIAKRGVDHCFAACKGDAAEKLSCLVDAMAENKLSVMHVYSSADRKDFDEGLDQVCEYLSFKLTAAVEDLPDAERICRRLLVKSCCYGLVSDWLSMGMEDEGRVQLLGLCGEVSDMIK